MSRKEAHLDPRVVRTRKLLREALMELIPEKGYHAISVADITERATLNRATFYLHYRDKDDLLLQGIEEIFDDLMASNPLPEVDEVPLPIHETPAALVGIFEHMAEHANFYRVMLGKEGVRAFEERLRDYIEQLALNRWQGVPKQARQEGAPQDVMMSFVAAGYLGVFRWWLEKGMPHPPEFMARQVVRIMALGYYQAMGMEAPEIRLEG